MPVHRSTATRHLQANGCIWKFKCSKRKEPTEWKLKAAERESYLEAVYLYKKVNDDKWRKRGQEQQRGESNHYDNDRCRKERLYHGPDGKREDAVNGGRVFGETTQNAAPWGAFVEERRRSQQAENESAVQFPRADNAAHGGCKGTEDFKKT